MTDKASAALGRIADDINDYQSFSEGFDEQDWYGEEDWDFDAMAPKDSARRFEASTEEDWATLKDVIRLARIVVESDSMRSLMTFEPADIGDAVAKLSELVTPEEV